MLQIVQEAATLAAAPLRHVGKPITVSKVVLDMLPPAVADIVVKNASRPRRDGLFPVTGAPKDRAIRYAVQSLWAIYDEATGKPPTMYSTVHKGETKGSLFNDRGHGTDDVTVFEIPAS